MVLGVQESKKTIFLVCGMSGAGKDSLVNTICENYRLKQLKSYSTRPRRQGEGDTHIFISSSQISQYEQDMIAYTCIDGNQYFATKQQLYDCDFYVIDPCGIEFMKKSNIDLSDFNFVTIFIKVPRDIRVSRALYNRKDDPITFYKRCFDETEQFTEMLVKEDFDYAVSNVDFDKAYNVLASIVESELQF